MTDSSFSRRRADLLTRVKRRRKEVETYLDDFFYSRCREVFRRVRAVDSADVLARLTGSPGRDTAAPDGWLTVKRRLDDYEYARAADFIEDMRALVNRCYASQDQGLIDVARNAELSMEDQFVQWLAVAPASFHTISELARRAPKSTKVAMVEMIAFYNVKCQTVGSDTQRVSVSASELPNATKFRLLKLLQSGVRHPTSHTKPPAAATARKTPIPPVTPRARPEPPPRPAPSKTLLSGPDGAMPFHDEEAHHTRPIPQLSSSATSAAPVQLERVPQNDPKETVSAAVVSPVIMQDDDEDVPSEDGDVGG